MVTFFTIPKAFAGHIGIIQRNALQSWSQLRPQPEIIVCGDELGTEEVTSEFGLKRIKSIEKSELGTPLLDDVFAQVARTASYHTMVYANSDIMFTNRIMRCTSSLPLRALISGRRWNTQISTAWNFTTEAWERDLEEYIKARGKLYNYDAMDYFIFDRRSRLVELPPFIVGRPGWDNWMIFRARQLRMRVIDATEEILAVHQNHDYRHVPQQIGQKWSGPEADKNRELKGIGHFSLLDATHWMTPNGIIRAKGESYRKRKRDAFGYLHPRLWSVVSFALRMSALVRKNGPSQ